jgi:hypothetical protein
LRAKAERRSAGSAAPVKPASTDSSVTVVTPLVLEQSPLGHFEVLHIKQLMVETPAEGARAGTQLDDEHARPSLPIVCV